MAGTKKKSMNVKELVAIDVHVHAEVSTREPLDDEKKAFEKKYGTMAPPPPPSVPRAPKATEKPEDAAFNSKDYKLSVADNNGECVVIVKNLSDKIIKAILLTEWNGREKYYSNLYGEIPPATPGPLRPTTMPSGF